MADVEDDWETPRSAQPQPGNYAFDLDRALASVVSLSARIPPDAFTAATLGVERAGNGVLIGEDGVVLTIGYLIAEAQEIWLTTGKGRVAPGHVLGYDQATGFGLVQALGPLDIPALPLGDSRSVTLGERVVIGGAGGRRRSVAAHLVARQEFAGYWEYVLDEALFTAPAHPNWGGTAMIGPKGDLLGIGSLHGKVVIVGFAGKCPAQRAGLHEGDAVLAVAGAPVQGLADFFRRIWALGNAGVEAPLTLDREGDVFEVRITSADRQRLLKTARCH